MVPHHTPPYRTVRFSKWTTSLRRTRRTVSGCPQKIALATVAWKYCKISRYAWPHTYGAPTVGCLSFSLPFFTTEQAVFECNTKGVERLSSYTFRHGVERLMGRDFVRGVLGHTVDETLLQIHWVTLNNLASRPSCFQQPTVASQLYAT